MTYETESFWLVEMKKLEESTESLSRLSYRISNSQDYILPFNVWFSCLTNGKKDDSVIKFILLGGCLAKMNKISKPILYLLTRKLLTWGIFAVGQRPLNKLTGERILRLLKMWQAYNLFGHIWTIDMISAFNGVPPEHFGLAEFHININGYPVICNSRALMEDSKDYFERGITRKMEKEIQLTLAKIKQEKSRHVNLPTCGANDKMLRLTIKTEMGFF